MFFQRESSRIKISCEKELMYIAKQEERLKKAVLRKTADGPSVFVWKEKLEQKISAKLYENLRTAFGKAFSIVFEQGTGVIEKTISKENLIKDYEVQNYAVELKGTRRELKQLR